VKKGILSQQLKITGSIVIPAIIILTIPAVMLTSCDFEGRGIYHVRNGLDQDIVITVRHEEAERFLLSPGQTMEVHRIVRLNELKIPPEESGLESITLETPDGTVLLHISPVTREGWEMLEDEEHLSRFTAWFVLDLNRDFIDYYRDTADPDETGDSP
jgi:hypothetical protein